MFWRFGGYSNISTIDTLLDKPNVKLEDLLDESDLIQELKSHHTKLIEFLRDDDNLHALLQYVIAPPTSPAPVKSEDDYEGEPVLDAEQDEAEKKRLKYAYISCEILSCETWSITEALMANTAHLTEFWGFLRKSPSLEPLQAGYFTKVNECLLEKKTEEMLDFFKSLPSIVGAILQHVDCPMVMDLLLKIISLEKAEGGAGIVDWLHSQDLIPMLLANLSPECNSSTQTSAGDFLKAIITISANAAQDQTSCIGPNSLTRQLVSESCIESLISKMLNGGNALTVGVGIVIEVIRKNNSDYDPESAANADVPPTSHDPIYLGTLLRLFAQHVPDFTELILSPKHTVTVGDITRVVDRGELASAWGTRIEPLGFDRFKTCELMAELLHCSNMGLLNERGSEEYVKARDEERERLRAQGAFSPLKPSEDSTIDLSTTSSRFDANWTPSASTDELRVANSNEDDGFEKVTASEAESSPGSSLASRSDLVDEPLSPIRTQHEPSTDSTNSPTRSLSNQVRRLSLEDARMTSPPPVSENSPISPHPEDKPAPLFTSKDPNKTPTPSSPEPPLSPLSTKSGHILTGSQVDADSTQQTETTMQNDQSLITDERPVVGDYLKMMFVENQVVPTILSFFFRFPWNNFLHNVVYDVVQQVFNGPMDRGYNKHLAFDLFETGRVTEQIIEGQKRSDQAQKTKNMRLGYMGHLTLVAEEVVKFGERQPREQLSPPVQDCIYGSEWEQYVTKTLAETRERDNAILGGFRPENGLGPRQAVLNAVNNAQGLNPSAALQNAGLAGGQALDSIELQNQLNNSGNTGSNFNGGGSMSGFGSSSDDDDEDMEDAEEEESRMAAISEDPNAPAPLIPPPPTPLNMEPSRARRLLADRLARKMEANQQEAAASEFGAENDDPFSSLHDKDEEDGSDPFSLDEEEQDITASKRSNNPFSNSHAKSSPVKGFNNLFSAGSNSRGFDELEDSSDDSGSDVDPENPPLEARRSLERRPLDIDDDDEEMGEMVAPSEEANSSDEGEIMSPSEMEKLGNPYGSSPEEAEDAISEFDGQEDTDDQLIEIAMPVSSKRRSRG